MQVNLGFSYPVRRFGVAKMYLRGEDELEWPARVSMNSNFKAYDRERSIC